MKYYKDINDNLHRIDEGYEHLLPKELTLISNDEAESIAKRPFSNAKQINILKAELNAMEREAIMPRGAREAFIALCLQQGAAAGLNATQLYAANPFFKGLKDTDKIASDLRAEIKALG